MITISKIKPIALGLFVTSCLTVGWQQESKAITLVLDDFTEPGTPFQAFPGFSLCTTTNYGQCVYFNNAPTPYTTDEQTGFSSVLGGSRDLFLFGSNAGNPPTNPAQAGANTQFGVSDTGGELRINNEAGTNSRGVVTYDGTDSGLGIDLSSASGFTDFELDIISFDQDGRITVSLTDSSSNYDEVFATVTDGFTGPLLVPLSGFTNIDFENATIDTVSFAIEGTENDLDARFTQVGFSGPDAEVPEPSSLLSILGVGVLGGIASRKKKNKI